MSGLFGDIVKGVTNSIKNEIKYEATSAARSATKNIIKAAYKTKESVVKNDNEAKEEAETSTKKDLPLTQMRLTEQEKADIAAGKMSEDPETFIERKLNETGKMTEIEEMKQMAQQLQDQDNMDTSGMTRHEQLQMMSNKVNTMKQLSCKMVSLKAQALGMGTAAAAQVIRQGGANPIADGLEQYSENAYKASEKVENAAKNIGKDNIADQMNAISDSYNEGVSRMQEENAKYTAEEKKEGVEMLQKAMNGEDSGNEALNNLTAKMSELSQEDEGIAMGLQGIMGLMTK